VSGAVKRERAIGYHWVSVNRMAAVDVGHRSVVVCYDLSVLHGLSLILTMYI
jgi:hypothetical protein